jgi:ribA/ribD-fused uncharacterized protein
MDLPRSRDEAIAAEQAGRHFKYLFFWGHRPSPDGSVGPGCLSQWWQVDFTEDGRLYRSAEHYMMAHKAWLFGDEETAEQILACGHPRDAKVLGRQARGFDQAVWERERFGIVVRASLAKFGRHPDLGAYLAASRGQVLVEASPRDRIWGIGLGAAHELAASPSTWQGLNLLGFALMAARESLAA